MAGVDPDLWNPDAPQIASVGSRKTHPALSFGVRVPSADQPGSGRQSVAPGFRKGQLRPSDLGTWPRTILSFASSVDAARVIYHLNRAPKGPGKQRGDGLISLLTPS